MTTIELTPRQRLVETLSGDLLAGAWDQRNKFWYVKGTEGDEWLEYVGEFTSSVENHMLDVILEESLPEDAVGVLVATEGWDYPLPLSTSLKAKGEHALKAYWALYPPSEHPHRVSTRNVMMTCADGEIIAVTTRRDVTDSRTWAHLDASVPCPTGNHAIDASRALIGQYPALIERLTSNDTLKTMKLVADTIDQAINGTLDHTQATLALLEAIPEAQRVEMVKGMPDELKDALRAVLPQEQHDKYGL